MLTHTKYVYLNSTMFFVFFLQKNKKYYKLKKKTRKLHQTCSHVLMFIYKCSRIF